jgi:hypothetical protein
MFHFIWDYWHWRNFFPFKFLGLLARSFTQCMACPSSNSVWKEFWLCFWFSCWTWRVFSNAQQQISPFRTFGKTLLIGYRATSQCYFCLRLVFRLFICISDLTVSILVTFLRSASLSKAENIASKILTSCRGSKTPTRWMKRATSQNTTQTVSLKEQ